jgi:hypothetical protein
MVIEMDREKDKKKINTRDEKIWVTQPMQRYGKDELTTMFVPNPEWKGRKNKKKHREDD